MSDRIKYIIAASLVVISIGMIVVNRIEKPEPIAALAPQPEFENVSVNPDSILSNEEVHFQGNVPDFENADVLALFVVSAKVCPPCINEITDYAGLLQNSMMPQVSIKPLLLVVEPDTNVASRFIKIINMPIPVGHMKPQAFVQALGRSNVTTANGDVSYRDIYFLDLASDLIIYRIGISARETPLGTKNALLERVVDRIRVNEMDDSSSR